MKLYLTLFMAVAILLGCTKTYQLDHDVEPLEDQGSEVLMIGKAKVNITPPVGQGIELSGFSSRIGSELKGIHDDIYARIIVLRDQNRNHFVDISVDLLGFSGVKQVVEGVHAEGIDIPAENFMIAATHNHSGPSVYTENSGTEQYELNLFDDLVEGVKEAYLNMVPGSMSVVKVQVPFTLFHNRQEIDPVTGQCILGKNPDGISDKEVIVKAYYNVEGRSLASTLLVAAHSTVMGEFNYHVSGDFAGYASGYLEKHQGDNHVALWMMGGGGDQSPRYYHQRSEAFLDPARSPEALGAELGQSIMSALDQAIAQDYVSILAESFMINLPLRVGGTHGRRGSIVMLNEDVVIVGVPYELFSSTTIEIKRKSPIPNTLIQSVTNGKDAYLPTPNSYGFNCYENRSGRHFDMDAERVFVQFILSKIEEMKLKM